MTTKPNNDMDISTELDDHVKAHEAADKTAVASKNEQFAAMYGDGKPRTHKRSPPAKRVARAEKIGKTLKTAEERKKVMREAYDKAGGFEGLAGRAMLLPVEDVPHKSNEYTGFSVSYYQLPIAHPTTPGRDPYTCECNDIIEALGMSYAEGNVFKALWRKCAARQGKSKRGYTDGKYDAEKMVFFSQRVLDDVITSKGKKE